jgi:hypothetical protein
MTTAVRTLIAPSAGWVCVRVGVMNRITAAVIVIMVGLFAACSAPTPPPPQAPRSARPAPVEAPLVDATCPRNGQGLVPPFESDDIYAGTAAPQGFEPATVVRCAVANGVSQQQDGSLVYTVEESIAALTPALTAALALPDILDPPDPNSACNAKADPVLYLLLASAQGKAYQPRVPITWCFAPRAEVIAALADITWEPRTSFEVKRTA